jgi:hypothetical protein
MEERRIFLSKLPNPDYYARIGQACYETLLLKVKKIKPVDQQAFVTFALKYEFSTVKPTPEHKLCHNFVKTWNKLEQPFNKERYISGKLYDI